MVHGEVSAAVHHTNDENHCLDLSLNALVQFASIGMLNGLNIDLIIGLFKMSTAA